MTARTTLPAPRDPRRPRGPRAPACPSCFRPIPRPPPATAAGAEDALGDAVSVYLDGGPCDADVPSRIVDLPGDVPRLLRAGAVSVGRLREVAALSTTGDA